MSESPLYHHLSVWYFSLCESNCITASYSPLWVLYWLESSCSIYAKRAKFNLL